MTTQQRFHGPLRRNPANPRYFTDDSGKAIYLTGSHTWANLVETRVESGTDFPYDEWLDMMQSHNHNFMRLWTWDHPEYAPWTEEKVFFDPMPFARTGPGLAQDGKPKFDLSRYDETFFKRLRERVMQAGERGIYAAVMFFEGWNVKCVSKLPQSDPWPSHPFNAANNVNGVNGVNGDPNGDGVADVYSIESPQVLEFQKAYMRQVIDTVNNLDNVLFEIINEVENTERGFQWSYHMVDFVHDYERTKPKQHPVGMTAEGGSQHNPILFASNADWISPGRGPNSEYKFDPPEGDGSKVILTDTDHLWGHGGTYPWVWKSFLRGLNPIFMDPWWPIPGHTRAGYAPDVLNQRDYPEWAPIRVAMGQTRQFAERMDLNSMTPRSDLSSSRYCLADSGRVYLVYVPDDVRVTVDLSDASGAFMGEWFATRTGEMQRIAAVEGGSHMTFTSPLGMDVVLFLQHRNT